MGMPQRKKANAAARRAEVAAEDTRRSKGRDQDQSDEEDDREDEDEDDEGTDEEPQGAAAKEPWEAAAPEEAPQRARPAVSEEAPEEAARRRRDLGAASTPPEEHICEPLESVSMLGRSPSSMAVDIGNDRKIMGAAAAVGTAAGLLLMGPVSAAALGAMGAYATTREDSTGTIARKVGAVYLQVADRAMDEGLQVAGRAMDEGRRQIAAGIDGHSIPAPLRRGLQMLVDGQGNVPKCEQMSREAQRMRERYPDRVPVICERSPYSELPEIEKKKFIVPGAMLCGEFKYIVHKHVAQAMGGHLGAEQTIYIFVNGVSPKTSTPMSELYHQLQAGDGFLHVRYAAENTLGRH